MELETVSLNAAAKMDGAFANSSRIWRSPHVGWCAGLLAIGWRRKEGLKLATDEDMAAAVKARTETWCWCCVLFGQKKWMQSRALIWTFYVNKMWPCGLSCEVFASNTCSLCRGRWLFRHCVGFCVCLFKPNRLKNWNDHAKNFPNDVCSKLFVAKQGGVRGREKEVFGDWPHNPRDE